MDIGTGIAIAGVWMFAGVVIGSGNASSGATWASILIASVLTTVFLTFFG